MLSLLVVAATGGLGSQLVREGLARGHSVSVMVRDAAKLSTVFSKDVVGKLSSVVVGDGSDPVAVAKAVAGKDVVLAAVGWNLPLAKTIAEESLKAGAKKFIFVAGQTNIQFTDGRMGVEYWDGKYPAARPSYAGHKSCIDAIQASGVNYIVYCPALMQATGRKSSPLPAIHTKGEPGMHFASYEDSAHVLLEAAEKATWDGQLITAATKQW